MERCACVCARYRASIHIGQPWCCGVARLRTWPRLHARLMGASICTAFGRELRRLVSGRHVTGRHVTGRHVTGRHVTGRHVTGRLVTGRLVTGRHVTGRLEAAAGSRLRLGQPCLLDARVANARRAHAFRARHRDSSAGRWRVGPGAVWLSGWVVWAVWVGLSGLLHLVPPGCLTYTVR